jgi:hypothetical protein
MTLVIALTSHRAFPMPWGALHQDTREVYRRVCLINAAPPMIYSVYCHFDAPARQLVAINFI